MTEENAIEKYKILFDLWMSENSIKTNKLQMLMATNAILVSALALANYVAIGIAIGGFVFSLVWIFSLGRTVAYQEKWKEQMNDLKNNFPNNEIFTTHITTSPKQVWGKIPSKYYLLGTPIATTIAWLGVIVHSAYTG